MQIDGTVIAPTSPSYWKAGSMQWLQLKQLTKGITIQGGGLIEGQGNAWWGNAHGDETNFPRLLGAQRKGKLPSRRPTALRFYGSYNVTVSGITIQNSPQCHLKFDNCDSVRVSNITISSPGDSPNTDGIHLQNSANVEIRQSVISCGDDCISIQTGSSMVHVQSVTCGPGHGISIGSLGEGRTAAWVSNVTVEHVAFVGTLTGVRIKTWQGGSGSLRDVKFSNIRVSHVQTPIVINQYYSDGRSNKNQSSAVAISQISYDTIIGTYTEQPVYLACSDSFPCKALSISNLDLEPEEDKYHVLAPYCWQAYGVLHGPVIPPVDCLKKAV
ncbi:hypothetical protein HPP92_004473 [Vanilla planifolia]|uniref:Polygalacturonase n=1 Tax=Vanilla planifolia TaxID=51239 RepID=A0A835VAF0_VANPL|nr:hypothetical protein HPP92_004473 [Vanilla planifolia]